MGNIIQLVSYWDRCNGECKILLKITNFHYHYSKIIRKERGSLTNQLAEGMGFLC